MRTLGYLVEHKLVGCFDEVVFTSSPLSHEVYGQPDWQAQSKVARIGTERVTYSLLHGCKADYLRLFRTRFPATPVFFVDDRMDISWDVAHCCITDVHVVSLQLGSAEGQKRFAPLFPKRL